MDFSALSWLDPWNTFGLHFTPNFPGVNEGPTDQGAPVRHELRGTATKSRSIGVGTIEGTITTFLCVNGMRADQIVSSYKARFGPSSARSVRLAGGGPVPTTGGLSFTGRFKVVDATGRFEDLEARGTMRGQFTCLPLRGKSSTCRRSRNPPHF